MFYSEIAVMLQPPKASPRKQDSGNFSSRKASRSFSGLMSDVPACINFMDPKDSYPAEFVSEHGPNDPSRELVRTARRVVVKVNLHLTQRAFLDVEDHFWSQSSRPYKNYLPFKRNTSVVCSAGYTLGLSSQEKCFVFYQ